MARAGGTAKITNLTEEHQRFLARQVALGLPTQHIQTKAREQFNGTFPSARISQMRNKAWREKHTKKWDNEVKQMERDFITSVGDRTYLFPIFRASYFWHWGQYCAENEIHDPAIKYFDLCRKEMENIPGNRILAEYCLSKTLKELGQAENNGHEEIDIVIARIRKRRTMTAEALKKLERLTECQTLPNE